MTTRRTSGLLVSACFAAATATCGDDRETSSTPAAAHTTQARPAAGSASGQSCRDVMVSGHQAVNITVTGTACATSEKVAAAAEGRGRAAYESGGFACTPSDATGGGDTNYSCSMGSATITFRYGTT